MEKWDLPKGKIEKGESIEQAALREVEEETALKDLTLEHFISHTYHIYTERDGKQVLKITHWFKMNYNGTDTPIPQTEEGITEATWKNQSEILTDVFPKTFKNIQLILEESQLLN
ncbi:NUDIX hydrolase [Bergeyella porcorum]|uniref:NUDIX hydrolase n=1 Tax=Bergeyella porcorum TaxID=1735111 RepID=A0AAU0F1S2_9FLAO